MKQFVQFLFLGALSLVLWQFAALGAAAEGKVIGYAIDVDLGTAGIQSNRTLAVEDEFDIGWVMEPVVEAWAAEQGNMTFDPRILAVVGDVEDTHLGDAQLCGGSPEEGRLFRGCARRSGATDASGLAHRFRLRCLAEGTTDLHFQTDDETGVATGTNFALADGSLYDPAPDGLLSDATIRCGDGAGAGSAPETPETGDASPSAGAVTPENESTVVADGGSDSSLSPGSQAPSPNSGRSQRETPSAEIPSGSVQGDDSDAAGEAGSIGLVDPDDSGGGGLSTGLLLAIVLPVAALVLSGGVGAYWYRRRSGR